MRRVSRSSLPAAARAAPRPPTKVTRRKQLDLDVKLPIATFLDLIRPLDTCDAPTFASRALPLASSVGLSRFENTLLACDAAGQVVVVVVDDDVDDLRAV